MARQSAAPALDAAAEGWFYARQGRRQGPAGRQGPVSLVRLKKLARKGWLTADDLVWHRDLPDWIAASDLPGLFNRRRLPALLKRVDDALGRLAGTRRKRLQRARRTRPVKPSATPHSVAPSGGPRPQRSAAVPPPVPPAAPPRPAQSAAKVPTTATALTIESIPPRYLLAGFAGMLAVLGVIFMLIEPSLLARLLLAGGLLALTAGLVPEIVAGAARAGGLIGRLLVAAVDTWRSTRERRVAVQQDEPLQQAAARRQGLAAGPAAGPRTLHAGTETRHEHASLGSMVVVREPPIKLWRRPVAGLLSFLLPGLGQCYKGHVLGGLVWFCCVSTGYATLVFPGLVLHLLCVAAAASGANYSEPRTEVIRE